MLIFANFFVNVLGFFVVVGTSFVVFALISSFLRFQRLSRQGVEEAEEVDPSNALLLNILHRLGTLHREPQPFIVMLLRVAEEEALVAQRGEAFLGPLMEAVLERLRSRLRADDFTAVIEGNRIAALLDVHPAHAPAIVRRIQEAFGSEPLRGGEGWAERVSLCIGVAHYPESGRRSQAIYEVARQRLDEASAGAGVSMGSLPPMPEPAPPDPRQAALIDELTGLLRPDRMDAAVQKFVARFRKEEKPVSILYLDVDHLDSYNEHYGRAGGDAILKALGHLLERQVREEDLVGRFDGEEFLIAMAGTPAQAALLGRRLIQMIRQSPVRMGTAQLRATVSIGVAGFPDHGVLPRDLFEAASAALFQAKGRGGGACAVFDPSLPRIDRPARSADTL